MAYKRLPKGTDRSDMELWGRNKCTTVFVDEIVERRATFLRKLIKESPTPEATAIREIDKIIELITEAKNLK